jgi:hypothetical protein
MASISGGLFQHTPAAPTHITAPGRPDAGALSLGSVTGGSGTGAQDDPRFAGGPPAGGETVVATTTLVGGDTLIKLSDGSQITLVNVIHPDAIIH